jgi:hypothetical protein
MRLDALERRALVDLDAWVWVGCELMHLRVSTYTNMAWASLYRPN